MQAFGAYMRALREGNGGMTREALSEAIAPWLGRGADTSTLFRIEKGEQMPKGDLLTFLLDILGGDSADVALLLRSEHATTQDGRELATHRLAIVAGSATEAQRRQAAAALRKLAQSLR